MRVWTFWPLSLVAILMWLLSVSLTQAQSPAGTELELILPDESAVGQETELRAHLVNSLGGAVVGAEVTFLREAVFMNTGNDLILGTAVTDETGVAVLVFIPRSEGEMLITAEFYGDSQYGAAFATGVVPIATGPALYVEEERFRVPGINVSLFAAVLGGVWSLFFVVLVLIWLISREGEIPNPMAGVESD
ncbi:MAG: Ig-like domain repeat protein [SAR202 cluster bacterium]|nr:Ig-like domain repeat protein [SAR202 cluster bacterium]